MNNFIFANKTKVYFGKGGVKEYLGNLLQNYGDTVMLAYGRESAKRNGVYDEVAGILRAQGKTDENNLSDEMNEAIMRSVIRNIRVLLKTPGDYDARSELA